ncbi:MAG: hypothetical protein QXQ20_04830 [Candidatus Nezhaarchaeales archaeon]
MERWKVLNLRIDTLVVHKSIQKEELQSRSFYKYIKNDISIGCEKFWGKMFEEIGRERQESI